MYRHIVSSSNIISIGYDQQVAILEVEFMSGDVYQYFDVPEHVYQGLMNASSQEQFMTDCIKYDYRYKKVR